MNAVRGLLRPAAEAALGPSPIADAAELLAHLRAGDLLTKCHGTGWHLVRADAPVASEAVLALQLAAEGRLMPAGDVLPGMDSGLSQTWEWKDAPRPGPELFDVFDVRNMLKRDVAAAGSATLYAKSRAAPGQRPLTRSQITDVTGGHKHPTPAVLRVMGLTRRYVALTELRGRR